MSACISSQAAVILLTSVPPRTVSDSNCRSISFSFPTIQKWNAYIWKVFCLDLYCSSKLKWVESRWCIEIFLLQMHHCYFSWNHFLCTLLFCFRLSKLWLIPWIFKDVKISGEWLRSFKHHSKPVICPYRIKFSGPLFQKKSDNICDTGSNPKSIIFDV